MRRRGVASALIAAALADPDVAARSVVDLETTDVVPAGEQFARFLGAQPKLVQRESECALDAIDVGMIRRWTAVPPEVAADYELWPVVGPFPPAHYAAIAEVQNIMNTAALDDLDAHPVRFTVEHIANRESQLDPDIAERRCHFIRHRATGQLVGYTRVWLYADWAGVAQQGDAAVHPDHRGRGLGKWLKASMVDALWRERPDIKRIRTANAYSNAPMLAINDAMGFQTLRTTTAWQAPLASVRSAVELRCRRSAATSDQALRSPAG